MNDKKENNVVIFRISSDEKKILQQFAKEENRSLSNYIVSLIRKDIKEKLQEVK